MSPSLQIEQGIWLQQTSLATSMRLAHSNGRRSSAGRTKEALTDTRAPKCLQLAPHCRSTLCTWQGEGGLYDCAQGVWCCTQAGSLCPAAPHWGSALPDPRLPAWLLIMTSQANYRRHYTRCMPHAESFTVAMASVCRAHLGLLHSKPPATAACCGGWPPCPQYFHWGLMDESPV